MDLFSHTPKMHSDMKFNTPLETFPNLNDVESYFFGILLQMVLKRGSLFNSSNKGSLITLEFVVLDGNDRMIFPINIDLTLMK